MKLAEALLLRADIQKRLASLRERINRNTVVQEGEHPAEDPNVLLEQAMTLAEQLKTLVFRINQANIEGKTATGRSLTEVLAERESVIEKHAIIQAAATSAAKPPERYGVKEIRWVKTVNVGDLQGQADEFAKAIRLINGEIQAANWQIDIVDIE